MAVPDAPKLSQGTVPEPWKDLSFGLRISTQESEFHTVPKGDFEEGNALVLVGGSGEEKGPVLIRAASRHLLRGSSEARGHCWHFVIWDHLLQSLKRGGRRDECLREFQRSKMSMEDESMADYESAAGLEV